MKKGVGCRIGGVAVRRLVVEVTFQGPTLDAEISLVDPDSKKAIGVSRKTRDWNKRVRDNLNALIDAVEESVVQTIFREESETNTAEESIADHLGKGEGQY